MESLFLYKESNAILRNWMFHVKHYSLISILNTQSANHAKQGQSP